MSIASPAIRRQRGFTIVELLIVIVVVGILAAITVVTYSGVQTRGKASATAQLVASTVRKIEAYKAVTGQLPTCAELVNNRAAGSTDDNTGPLEAKTTGLNILCGSGVSEANGTSTVTYVNQDASCGWIDWWDYLNGRRTTLSTTPKSTKIGC